MIQEYFFGFEQKIARRRLGVGGSAQGTRKNHIDFSCSTDSPLLRHFTGDIWTLFYIVQAQTGSIFAINLKS